MAVGPMQNSGHSLSVNQPVSEMTSQRNVLPVNWLPAKWLVSELTCQRTGLSIKNPVSLFS